MELAADEEPDPGGLGAGAFAQHLRHAGSVFGGEGGPIRSENSVNTSYRSGASPVHQAVGDQRPTIAGRNAMDEPQRDEQHRRTM